MTNEEKPSDASAEWEETQRALEAAYKLLDTARQRESKDRDEHGKLVEAIKVQAGALDRISADRSVFRRALEYSVLVVILALAAYLLYLARELQLLLR
jgi:hypothetical protein